MGETKVISHMAKVADSIRKFIIDEQTRRLVEYAKAKVQEIGERIQTYGSRNHMNRTGNLLDSLCWSVAFNGNVVESGYYQNKARELSYLHEFYDSRYNSPESYHEAYPVGGHTLAENYIKQYGGGSFTSGWHVVFAILAPYWAYWEEGFNFKRRGISLGRRQFAVMTESFSQIEKDLKPSKVQFKNKVPAYTKSYTIKGTNVRVKGSLERRYDRYSNDKSNPYKPYSRRRYKY